MKPFKDLACTIREGLPVCDWLPQDAKCAFYDLHPTPDDDGELGDVYGLEGCPHCCQEAGDLCAEGTRRMASVFEAARANACDAHPDEWGQRIARIDGAIRAVNANLEDSNG